MTHHPSVAAGDQLMHLVTGPLTKPVRDTASYT
jgi:hypothetical protein